jgi:hypothetical protein
MHPTKFCNPPHRFTRSRSSAHTFEGTPLR